MLQARYKNQCSGTGRNSPPPQGNVGCWACIPDHRTRPGIPGGLVVAAADLTERFAKASSGGQGINTTDSKVQLSIDIAACASLSDAQRRRALQG